MSGISELIEFLKSILTKWIFWLFVVLDIVGVLANFFFPNFKLPTNVYGFLAMIGFVWAGFQVYKESKVSYRELRDTSQDQIETLREAHRTQLANLQSAGAGKESEIISESSIDIMLRPPSLDLTLREGQEYVFTMNNDPTIPELKYSFGKGAKKLGSPGAPYFLHQADLTFYLRMENTGCDLDILSISVEWRPSEFPFYFFHGVAYTSDKMQLPYPARLNADTALEFEIITMAEPTSVNNAQFASRLRGLRDKKCFAKAQILIETTSRSKGRKDFTLDVNVSSIPLANLYLAEWRDKNQVDLIRLAGG